jgi:hypothetical protein
MTRKLALLAAVSTVALLGVQQGAQAIEISLAGTTSGLTFTGSSGTLVNVSIAAGTTGASTLVDGVNIPGSYTLGGVSFTGGPLNAVQQYPVTVQLPPSETFTYSDTGGNALTGDIKWNFVEDATPNPGLFGTMTVVNSSGSAFFTGAFIPNSMGLIDITARNIAPFLTLDALVAANGTVTVGISAGEVTPGPIVGAGLPGLVAACGGLLALARRRRKQTA